jgi:hypothetical protein
MAVGRQTTQQGCGKARRRRPIRLAAQLVQTAAREAAARQNPIDLGQPQRQDRATGPLAVIEPGELGAQLVEQRLSGGRMRCRGHGRASNDRCLILQCSLFVLWNGQHSVKALPRKEPPTGNPLLGLEQTIVTPHCAGATIDHVTSLALRAIVNTRCWLAGEALPPSDVVVAPKRPVAA